MVPVGPEWPQAAREAYAAAGFEWAPTCPQGQRRDMRWTSEYGRFGWCYDRAYSHPESGLLKSSAEIQAELGARI